MRLTLWLLGTVLFVFNALADDTDTLSHKPIVLNEVIIQSFKQNKNLNSLPISASAIDKSSLQNMNVSAIKDISSFIPNLFMPDYGAKISSSVYIRGIGSKINDLSVDLYMDGVSYFQKSVLDFNLNEIESIEVLRDPQGILYGRKRNECRQRARPLTAGVSVNLTIQ
jgi:outer membrane receptor protein involved in Fe transport